MTSKLKTPYRISKVVNTPLEVHVVEVLSITLTVDLPLKALSAITVCSIDQIKVFLYV